MAKLTRDKALWMYETMQRIRRFEERAIEVYKAGEVPGIIHAYIGEEAIASGVCAHLTEKDQIVSTHRGHGHMIAKGLRFDGMFAELYGRVSGYCKGKGGSMHIADQDMGALGATGIVGSGIPIAPGAALALSMNGGKEVVVSFFGDGASNEGAFHEGLNLASIWKLPVVFVCENNHFAKSTPQSEHQNVKDVAERAKAYGIPGVVVDGMDPVAVYEAAGEAVRRARAGRGPTLIEAKTMRFWGHYLGDPGTTYGHDKEVARWKKRDPVPAYREFLLERKWLASRREEEILARIDAELEAALALARKTPEPGLDTLRKDVYANERPSRASRPRKRARTREIPYREAILEALDEEMARDGKVFLMGEDVAQFGGLSGTTRGLFKKYGLERVRNTPLSEGGLIGATLGAALLGMRPVAEIQYFDFTTVAMDQIVNQVAKIRYMFGGKARTALVIRGQGGGGSSTAAQHSQSLEAWFVHVPGLKVVMPSTPHDAKGLLKSAIRDDDPVLFIEHKLIFGRKGPVPEGEYTIPLGVAEVKREGKDVTIVATSSMVWKSLQAAEELEKEGILCEVVDPRTLYPLDKETILASVRKTGRLLITHEAVRRCGWGAEMAAIAASEGFGFLKAPVERVCAEETPVPYAPGLERAHLPSEEDVMAAVRRMLGRTA